MSETVTGTLAGITEKPTGWTTIEVAVVGSQYTKKLDTKIQELIELARAAGTQTMEWSFTEEDSGTPNPHKPGSNYVNRRFTGVAPVGTSPQTPGSVATPDASARAYAPDLRDRMIVRQTALKAAAEIVGPRAATAVDPDYDAALETLKAAARFETWVYRDIDEPPF